MEIFYSYVAAHKSKNEKKGTPVKEKKGDLKKPVNKDKERVNLPLITAGGLVIPPSFLLL